jgi:hypothetical protein
VIWKVKYGFALNPEWSWGNHQKTIGCYVGWKVFGRPRPKYCDIIFFVFGLYLTFRTGNKEGRTIHKKDVKRRNEKT